MTVYTCFSFLLKPIHIFKHTVTYFQVFFHLNMLYCISVIFIICMSKIFLLFKYHFFSFILYTNHFPLFFPIYLPPHPFLLHLHSGKDRPPMGLHETWVIELRTHRVCSLTSCWGQVIQHGEHVTKRHLSARTGPSLTVRSLMKRLRYTITHMQSK